MSNIAIITARGGSKRIPKKNIKNFCGKPIIAYSIEAALQSGIFDEVMVSTDSEEIAEIARQYGAKVPFLRSAEAANDIATTVDACKEVLLAYEKEGKTFDYYCCLYPTAPFVTPDNLKKALDMLIDHPETLSVFPVTQFSYPPQRGFYLNREGQLRYVQPEHLFTRSQDLPKIYHDCGLFYFVNYTLFKEGDFYNDVDDSSRAIVLGENEVQDIDTPEDWSLAELKYRFIYGS